MRFIDEARLEIKAGNGGGGALSFRREPYVSKGGPDGGDGGNGGNVIFRASQHVGTLADLNHRYLIKAKNGAQGQGSKKNGRNAPDIFVDVPLGTIVYDHETDLIIADLIDEGQTVIIAKGGQGGRGNARFASSINRAPRRHDPGFPGQQRVVRLEMKLIADIGLVGRPNAGKSTLLAALTRANPRIGAFPFSTLTPGLGVVPFGQYQRFVIADIPGLAIGAAEGRGLGHQFLRHIERTRLLAIMIETPDSDYQRTYETLINDMKEFSVRLAILPRLVIRSKSDLVLPEEYQEQQKGERMNFDHTFSAVTGEGIKQLVDLMGKQLGLNREPGL